MGLTPIPYSFLRENVVLSWKDVAWGYDHRLIGWPVAVGLALDRIERGSNNSLEIELAGFQKEEAHQVGELVRELAEIESPASVNPSEKWLFQNKMEVDDPLGEVESIYADFGILPR